MGALDVSATVAATAPIVANKPAKTRCVYMLSLLSIAAIGFGPDVEQARTQCPLRPATVPAGHELQLAVRDELVEMGLQ